MFKKSLWSVNPNGKEERVGESPWAGVTVS